MREPCSRTGACPLRDDHRPVGAIDHFERALTLDPHNAAAWFNFGNLLHTQCHDSRRALEAYRKAYGEAQFSLGALLIETGDYEGAVLTLQSALQVAKPDVPWRADARATPDMERARALGATGVLRSPRK